MLRISSADYLPCVLIVHRNRKAYQGRGEEGGGGVEVGGGGGEGGYAYTYHYTVTTRMTPALRWAAIRAILMLR